MYLNRNIDLIVNHRLSILDFHKKKAEAFSKNKTVAGDKVWNAHSARK
jgi:hypothetical protein